MEFIWALIIGGIVGWLGQVIVGRDIPGGIIGNVICGVLGAWVASLLFHTAGIGPEGGIASFIASVIGAVIVVFVFSLVAGRGRR
jgi:uncharacterized membrane protein YeaQ/YmgE (transglycosylase-associated protein family)